MARYYKLMNKLTDKEKEAFLHMACCPFFLIDDVIKDIEKYLKEQGR